MKLHTLLFFTNIYLGLCEECVLDRRTAETRIEHDLRVHLRTCSHPSKPPLGNITGAPWNIENAVIVSVGYLLQSFTMDFEEETITLYSWNYFDWQDDRLKWKSEDYDCKLWIAMSSFEIWTPGLKLVNTVNADDFDFFYGKCRVNNTGNIRCVLRADHQVVCKSKMRNWPYDTKICELKFDQWRPEEARVIFNLSHVKFVMFSYRSAGWEIVESHVSRNVTTGIQPTVTFQLQRLAEGIEIIIVIPCFVLAVLTTVAFFLDCKEFTRLGVLLFSMIGHFALLTNFSLYVPKHSKDSPVILLFLSGSTVLTLISLVLSFGFKRLERKKTRPAQFLTTYTDLILDNFGRYFVISRWNMSDKDSECNVKKEWNNIISIFNSVCLCIVVVTYICLFAVYMPQKTPELLDFDII